MIRILKLLVFINMENNKVNLHELKETYNIYIFPSIHN